MLRHAMFSALICLAGAAFSMAQEMEKPGPEHEQLKQFVGTWDAVMEFAGQKSKAMSTYKSICGGMWVASDFKGDFAGMPFEGHGVDGYDQKAKKYVSVWVDSMSSSPLRMEGNYDPKTKAMVMTGESRGPDGQPQKFKAITEIKDKDHFTFKMHMVQPDGQEQVGFTIEYTRKK
jgi:hypothetical protein